MNPLSIDVVRSVVKAVEKAPAKAPHVITEGSPRFIKGAYHPPGYGNSHMGYNPFPKSYPPEPPKPPKHAST